MQNMPSPADSATLLGKRSSDFKTPPMLEKPQRSAVKLENNPSTVKKEQNGGSSLEVSMSQATGIAYAERPSRGETVLTLNPGLGERGEFEPSSAKPIGARCRIESNPEDFDNCSGVYRYMFTTLEERARSLDKHLLHLQQQLCAFASIEDGDLHPVGVPSQDTVWVCGRICCEAAEGRINKTSVVLEGSRRDSAGRRVHLDLQELSTYSLFPGQVVLVEGVNSSGRKMVAKRIIEGIPKPSLTSPASQLLQFHHSKLYQSGAPLNVITAAGPFTTSDNLDYAPLTDLLWKTLKSKPDVLILVGPFVDVRQPLLANGEVQLANPPLEDAEGNELPRGVGQDSTHGASYEMVFVEKIIRDGLQQFYNSDDEFGVSPTHIILVPSLYDAHHEFVFPQPPFGDRETVKTTYFEEDLGRLNVPFSDAKDPRKRVHFMPNPCMFRYVRAPLMFLHILYVVCIFNV
jgi:DNA polymerase alpha subunit B